MSPLATIIGASFVALGIAPQSDVVRESVDLIELNHFYDEHGRFIFDQIIFYDWSTAESRYNVRAWRMVKSPSHLPQRDWRLGGYVVFWQDAEVIRRVRSASFRETWTQYDPELVEREHLPKERRKDLRTVRVDRPSPQSRPAAYAANAPASASTQNAESR